jgi:DMSO/TMAO reductase YedYZ molybdopterin-dependent catalytic subunit
VNIRFDRTLSRRTVLRGSLLTCGALFAGFETFSTQDLSRDQGEEPFRNGRKLGVVNFTEEAPVPMGKAFGAELDERLYTDLSKLTPGNAVTPAEEFYIRTGASRLLDSAKLSSIAVGGLVQQPFELSVADLAKQAKPMGLHLMECAGNVRAVHFGLMSVANWTGVPVEAIIDAAKLKLGASRVLISGFDRYAAPSPSSVPGASWIFTLDELRSAHAFLATGMDGQPLSADHGAPVRLVVPGWYGCACIKWVNEITMVDDSSAATSQMQEYAARTLQKGVPQLARDYEPATVDQAAMPIRVEQWTVGEKIKYRVVGILWGGSQPVTALEIRFNPEEGYVPVDRFQHSANDPWSFWSHAWTPQRAGTYMIRLRVKEPRVRARKMDAGYYLRTVEITET